MNHTAKTSTEGVEESAYSRTIPAAGTEVIDNLTVEDPGSPSNCLPQRVELYSDGIQRHLMRFKPSSLGTTFWSSNFPAYSSRLTSNIFIMQYGRGINVLELPIPS